MNNNIKMLQSVIEIADIHANRITAALKKTEQYFPLKADTFKNTIEKEIGSFEILTSRFSKLQDLMGTKLFPLILECTGEPGEYPSIIDKLNYFEKLGLKINRQTWDELRSIRNHISHEYPHQPEIACTHLNVLYQKIPVLFDCYSDIKQYLNNQLQLRL